MHSTPYQTTWRQKQNVTPRSAPPCKGRPMKPRLLDLFCGAGGSAKGYQRAGFYVVGVDIKPQPHYCGDEFHRGDAMTWPLEGFDVIHASPPCQAYSVMTKRTKGAQATHPDLIAPMRRRLQRANQRWVIENV